jgi:hypothetical protein
MDYSSFNYTLDMANPPEDFSTELKALWWERKGYWDKAHSMVQDLKGRDAAWVHAYLHRKEGDECNAGYWYQTAGKPAQTGDLHEEFKSITTALLAEDKS